MSLDVINGHTALITGASSGIGREMAKQLAGDGVNLILVARGEESLRSLADEIRDPAKVSVIPKDLSRANSPQELFDELKERELQVDILINNAGFGALGKFVRLSTERQLDMIRVNVTSLTHLTRLFMPGMVERGFGGVLNVASLAGFQPGANMAVYYATKAYVLSFTEAIAEEVRRDGVHVTCLAPGATETKFGADSGMGKSRLFRLGTMTASEVAKAGLDGLRRNRVVVVPGLKNKLSALAVRFVPRSLVRKLVKKLQQV